MPSEPNTSGMINGLHGGMIGAIAVHWAHLDAEAFRLPSCNSPSLSVLDLRWCSWDLRQDYVMQVLGRYCAHPVTDG